MPGMSGRALAEQLEHERPDLPVLYTSGHTSGRIGGESALGAGANFIQKPFSADELATKVREILDARRRAKAA
jgi:FixJ family two-component response regulator